MAKKGLGKGLDSLIPNFYDEDFDSNSTQSLEDMLADDVDEKIVESIVEEDEVEENDQEDNVSSIEEEDIQQEEIIEEEDIESEEISSDEDAQNDDSSIKDSHFEENIKEVKEIVNKNPRITLWSSRSSAVFRYLRKTEPEFSISKEASILIDEAVSKKYPEIWKLFEDD